MQKSILTFGLLLSSVVMLAVMPMLSNNNSFSNTAAMAQEYDNYYDENNNSYSKYPTDNKKYECRTGPFEGFFVSSVEFCKHVKFDNDDNKRDIRDNRTGDKDTTGNITILSPKLYQVRGEVATPTIGNQSNPDISLATCDPGDFILNGAIQLLHTEPGFQPFGLISLDEFYSSNGQSYQITVHGENLQVEAVGHCFDNPPLRP
jgi:hypothetical protein